MQLARRRPRRGIEFGVERVFKPEDGESFHPLLGYRQSITGSRVSINHPSPCAEGEGQPHYGNHRRSGDRNLRE